MKQPVIYIQPVEVWTYYKEEHKRLEEEMVEIASNEDTKTSVYITDEGGVPYLYVYRDDKKIFQSECQTQYEAERNLRVIYARYLTPLSIVDETREETEEDDDVDTPPCDIKSLDQMTDEEFEKYVDERESAILSAICDLIEVLTEDESGILEFCSESEEDDSLDIVVNNIVEYLAIKCGFRIRRPMEVVNDDSGLIERTEYPYEDFDFGEGELSLKQ